MQAVQPVTLKQKVKSFLADLDSRPSILDQKRFLERRKTQRKARAVFNEYSKRWSRQRKVGSVGKDLFPVSPEIIIKE